MLSGNRFIWRALFRAALAVVALLHPSAGYSVSTLSEIEEVQKSCLGSWGEGTVEIHFSREKMPNPDFRRNQSGTAPPVAPPVDIEKIMQSGMTTTSDLIYRQDDNGNIRADIEEVLVAGGNVSTNSRTLYFLNGKTIVDYGPNVNAAITPGYAFEDDPIFLQFANLLSSVPFAFRSLLDEVPKDSLLKMGWQDVVVKETDKGVAVSAQNLVEDYTAELQYSTDDCLLPITALFVSGTGRHESWAFEYQQVGGAWYLQNADASFTQDSGEGADKVILRMSVDVAISPQKSEPVEPPVFKPGKQVSDTETGVLYIADENGILQPFRRISAEGEVV